MRKKLLSIPFIAWLYQQGFVHMAYLWLIDRIDDLSRLIEAHRPGPRKQVTSFDYWQWVRELANTVSQTLTSANIDHIIFDAKQPIIAVPADSRPKALEIIAKSARPLYFVELENGLPKAAKPAKHRPAGDSLVLTEYLIAPDRTPITDMSMGVRLDFWTQAENWTSPVVNETAETLTNEQWKAAQATHRFPSAFFKVTEPIDIVYSWVDGGDPEWQAKKAAVMGVPFTPDANQTGRYVEHDELKYSLRSIKMFASWVRHVYVVSDCKPPAWLNTDDDFITWMDFPEFFADPSVLPVFNSHAIEAQLQNIPGLSEQYLYLNDDFLFGRPVEPEVFFTGNGKIKLAFSRAVIDPEPVLADDIGATAGSKNARKIVYELTGKMYSNKLRHAPYGQLKSVMRELEERIPDTIARIAASKLRSPQDIAITSSMAPYYAYCTGRAVTGDAKTWTFDLTVPDAIHQLRVRLRQRAVDTICVNTADVSGFKDGKKRDDALHEFFERMYPVAGPWERQGIE
ncbi:MAG: stealth family protein [Propionibacteriaceae bacterium]|jgi:hypothetical protein|nr:stealth family protein [Propionibacteriaceae bacterium]